MTYVKNESCAVLGNFVNNTRQIKIILVKLYFHHISRIKTPITNYANKC